jgi:hypothetical protein
MITHPEIEVVQRRLPTYLLDHYHEQWQHPYAKNGLDLTQEMQDARRSAGMGRVIVWDLPHLLPVPRFDYMRPMNEPVRHEGVNHRGKKQQRGP